MSFPQDASPGYARKPVRILVADDQAVNRKLTLYQLERLGFAVDVAENGQEALEALSRNSYDLVFMDCHMPAIDGFEATQELRRREGSGRRTPVVALTASVVDRDRDRCLAAGMDDFVVKPVSHAELLRVLARWVLDAAPPPLDVKALELVRQASDDVLQEVIGIYLAQAPAQVASIREAVARGDARILASAAHALRSSSGNVGARRVVEVCTELEKIGRAGGSSGAAELARQLTSEYERAERALRELHHP